MRRLTKLEEDEEITADKQTQNSAPLSQPVPSGYGLGENKLLWILQLCLLTFGCQGLDKIILVD